MSSMHSVFRRRPAHAAASQRIRRTAQLLLCGWAGAICASAQLSGPNLHLPLPAGTAVDDVRWSGPVLEIDLTLPLPGPPRNAEDWHLAPVEIEQVARAFAAPFQPDPTFGGTRIRARFGAQGTYGSLDQCLVPQGPRATGADSMAPEGVRPLDGGGPEAAATGAPGALRGPVTNAARQPTGALSGVTIFTSAGHGWTAGDTSWALQRPVQLEMAEDYGNIDQLNYFVAYAFNAGATVVPFRPVGWQPIEIVLDVASPAVTFAGTWSDGTGGKYYGAGYKWTDAASQETATARFTPTIAATGFYPVFCFTVPGANRTLQTYRIRHSGGVSAVAIDHRLVGNGWIWLGEYYLEAGGESWVEITNAAPEAGVIVADAIRWGDGIGDIARPGPNQVSGYPRDEEASRYWAHGELGNHATGFDSGIWDLDGSDDTSDNVGTAARWGREMNQEPPGGVLVDRWKRIYLEFHTNATNGSARGQMCLVTDLGATTYQVQYADTLAHEVDAEMMLLQSEFEHSWYNRNGQTYTSSYGAICTPNNGNEFDATIVELAFHDNQDDAELLRDDRVRGAMARACVHGIIKFLNTLPGSPVPVAYAPDTPRDVAVRDAGNGAVVLTWQPPVSDLAHGDLATGYVIYQSRNGYGFGDPVVVGNVLTATISGVPVGETRYFRVAATNPGGESMPSAVLALRRPAQGTAPVLLVNGFDRLRRQINPIQTFTQPPAYAGLHVERQQWRRSNSYDYVIQHAEALAANDYGFASCGHDAVADGHAALAGYPVVIWMLGTESGEDITFTTTEQAKVSTYLQGGGAIFVTGADIAYDLVSLNHGLSFCQDTLKVGYAANGANTYQATGATGGLLNGIGPLDFSLASGATYDVRSPDVLNARTGARACLNYVGGAGGVAGVQYTGPVYNAVTFGFPFEAIGAPALRAAVMGRVVQWLATAAPLPFDKDLDGDVDWTDFVQFAFCLHGPGTAYPPGHICLVDDGDGDSDVDLLDFAQMQVVFTGPL